MTGIKSTTTMVKDVIKVEVRNALIVNVAVRRIDERSWDTVHTQFFSSIARKSGIHVLGVTTFIAKPKAEDKNPKQWLQDIGKCVVSHVIQSPYPDVRIVADWKPAQAEYVLVVVAVEPSSGNDLGMPRTTIQRLADFSTLKSKYASVAKGAISGVQGYANITDVPENKGDTKKTADSILTDVDNTQQYLRSLFSATMKSNLRLVEDNKELKNRMVDIISTTNEILDTFEHFAEKKNADQHVYDWIAEVRGIVNEQGNIN